MKSTALIRKMQLSDLSAVLALINSEPGLVIPRTREEILRHMKSTYLIKTDGRIVGCAIFEQYTPRIAEIRSVVVHPDYRRRGYASRLIRHICHNVAAPGQRIIVVTANVEFFIKQGFSKEQQNKQVLCWEG